MSNCLAITGSLTTTIQSNPQPHLSVSGPWLSVTGPVPQSPETFVLSRHPVITIKDRAGEMMVEILSDGNIVFGDESLLEPAARKFWETMRVQNPFEARLRIYRDYIRYIERENHELRAQIRGETVVGSHLDDDGEGAG